MDAGQTIYLLITIVMFGINAFISIPFWKYSMSLCSLIKNKYPNDFERLGKPWVQKNWQGSFFSFLKLIYSSKQEFPQDKEISDLISKAKTFTTPWMISMGLIFILVIYGVVSGLLQQSILFILYLFKK